jgi:hypothetical protein
VVNCDLKEGPKISNNNKRIPMLPHFQKFRKNTYA